LQVVHNDPYKINVTTTNLDEISSTYDEEDDVDEIVFEKTTHPTTTTTTTTTTIPISLSSKSFKPSILKIYSENITVKIGSAALLKCSPRLSDKLGHEGEILNKLSLDEYTRTKSVK
jgi:hypothetical protein